MSKFKPLESLWKIAISLRLAVAVILTLAVSLIVGTFLESIYDTPTAKYWVYSAQWFHGVLFLLGVNILCVALSRYPWKKHHIEFLMAHAGILMLLSGSLITQKIGIDGSIQLDEGKSTGIVEFDQSLLTIQRSVVGSEATSSTDASPEYKTFGVRWTPPHVAFRPWKISEYDLEVTGFLPHAQPIFQFLPVDLKTDSSETVSQAAPAIHLKLVGGPMGASAPFWLWAGEPGWSRMNLGPAEFFIVPENHSEGLLSERNPDKPRMVWVIHSGIAGKPQRVTYHIFSKGGEPVKGEYDPSQMAGKQKFKTGWMNFEVEVLDWVGHAVNRTTYEPAKIQYGANAPPSAIRVRASNDSTAGDGVWLGLGDRAVLKRDNGKGVQEFEVTYSPRRIMLPFAMSLERFDVNYYPGSNQPKDYQSTVKILGEGAPAESQVVSMNEPMKWKGFTVYQASYIPGEPRPITSVFTVNQDPGRPLKYGGSLLIVLGSILLFLRKLRTSKKGTAKMESKQAIKTSDAVLVGLILSLLSASSLTANEGGLSVKNPGLPRPGFSMAEARLIPVHQGGRIKPLESFASEVVLSLTESRHYKNWDSTELLLSLVVAPEKWRDEPMIKVGNPDLRKQLILPADRNRFSPNELWQNQVLIQYAEEFFAPGGQKQSQVPNVSEGAPKANPREADFKKLLDRLNLVRELISGDAWVIVPPATEGETKWSPLTAQTSNSAGIRTHFSEMLRAYAGEDADVFSRAANLVKFAVEGEISGWTDGDRKKLFLETLYYQARPFYVAMILYLVAGLIWMFSLMIRPETAGKFRIFSMAWIMTYAGLAAHLFGFGLRMWVSGRPPVTNMYESVIWVSLGVMVFSFAIYASTFQKILPAVATFVAAFSLLAADSAPAILDPGIHPLVPVLRSNFWLTIHVLTITLGYAAFALSMGIGMVALVEYLRLGIRKQPALNSARTLNLNQMNYRAVQFGTVLLAAGTILGGVWADYSWGRFWGWDPKETWALIALLIYIAILHGRYTGWVGQFAFTLSTVLGFAGVVMAWYGVNFVLGVGLHSYGFASGGNGWVFGTLLVQMAFTLVVAAIHHGAKRRLERSRISSESVVGAVQSN